MWSSRIWQRFRQIQCFFPQIVPRIVRSGVWNLPNRVGKLVKKLEIATRCSLFGRVKLNMFWRKGTKTEPSASGFGAQDPRLTTGAIGSGWGGQVRASWASWLVKWIALAEKAFAKLGLINKGSTDLCQRYEMKFFEVRWTC